MSSTRDVVIDSADHARALILARFVQVEAEMELLRHDVLQLDLRQIDERARYCLIQFEGLRKAVARLQLPGGPPPSPV